jgi:dTDP-L-rhamnose 4-epimerase
MGMRSDSSKAVVLITGGAGFIGSHTADALIGEGYHVRILDCLDPQIHGPTCRFPGYLHPQIECIRGDVRQSEDVRRALKDVSFVYHFAALTGVGQSMYNLKNYTDVNISGTANLIETIIKHRFPVKKFILASSRAVYGEGTHLCPSCGIIYPSVRNLDDMEQNRLEVFCPKCSKKTISVTTKEDRPLMPISVYGWTKKLQEELCQYAAKTFGLSTVILRYYNVYGSRQSLVNPYTGVISIFFSRFRAAKAISLYEHGIPVRDFVHVLDVVQANLKALASEIPTGMVINVGTGTETSIFDIARALALAVGKDPVFKDIGEFRLGDVHACVADLSRSKKLMDYQPKISIEEGLREFVAWAQSQQTVDIYHRTVEELKTHGLFGHSQSKVSE